MSSSTNSSSASSPTHGFNSAKEYGRSVLADVGRRMPALIMRFTHDEFVTNALSNVFGNRMRGITEAAFPLPASEATTWKEENADPLSTRMVRFLAAKCGILMNSCSQMCDEVWKLDEDLHEMARLHDEVRVYLAKQAIEAVGEMPTRREVEEHLIGQGLSDAWVQDITAEAGRMLVLN